MQESSDEIPQLLLEEALASTPYMVKAALAEAKAGEGGAVPADLAEIEAALSLLRVAGWREGDASGRSPVLRRNLLLLHAHLHRERLNALTLAESTQAASFEVVEKSRRLLDVLLAYALQLQWAKPALAITALQGLLVNGLWAPEAHTVHALRHVHAFSALIDQCTLCCTGGITPTTSASCCRSTSWQPSVSRWRRHALASLVPAAEPVLHARKSPRGDAHPAAQQEAAHQRGTPTTAAILTTSIPAPAPAPAPASLNLLTCARSVDG